MRHVGQSDRSALKVGSSGGRSSKPRTVTRTANTPSENALSRSGVLSGRHRARHSASDVDQGVDTAKVIQHLVHYDLGGGGYRQVEFEHERFGAYRFDLLANFAQFLSAASAEDDCSEVASQPKCRGLSNTRACACDDRDRSGHVLLLAVLRG